MFSNEARDARRTESYLERLTTADERRAAEVPVDVELDPAVRVAARQLRADLLRVHPSFRFEEGLAARLALAAARMEAGLPIDGDGAIPVAPAAIASFRPEQTPVAARPAAPSMSLRLPSFASKPSRPFVVGGVASAALSIGAVYIAWRWSRPSPGPMVRAVRAAHANRGVQDSHRSRRSGVRHGILGVVS